MKEKEKPQRMFRQTLYYCPYCEAHQSKTGLVTFQQGWIKTCPYCKADLIETTNEDFTETQTNTLVSLRHKKVKQG